MRERRHNFEIRIGKVDEQHNCTISLDQSPDGRKTTMISQKLPQSAKSISDLLEYARARMTTRAEVKELGKELYKFLFPAEIRTVFEDAHAKHSLRLRIGWETEEADLYQLPWECLHDGKDFLLHNESISLVRYPYDGKPSTGVGTPKPLKVLLVTSGPSDQGPLGEAANVAAIKEAFQGEKRIEVDILEQATRQDFTEKLNSFEPHVLYMVAHGHHEEDSGEGYLALRNDQGNTDKLTAEDLGNMLGAKSTRLVILSSCHSGSSRPFSVAPHLARSGIPAVIAMQYAVNNRFAHSFVRTMCKELAKHGDVEEALMRARKFWYGAEAEDNKINWVIPAFFSNAYSGQLWHAPGQTAVAYETNVNNFLTEYVRNKDKGVPFGGRQAELEQLTQWLDDPDSPSFGLLTAQAGRGKSALLANWTKTLDRNDLHVIFFPISIRFDTSLDNHILEGLVTRLANIHMDKLETSTFHDLSTWKAQLDDYLQRTPPFDDKLIVIMDGLDEAVTEPGTAFFPADLGTNVKVLVSARLKAGDEDEQGWLERLNWSKQTTFCFDLPPLNAAGIADVLTEMSNPLDHFVTNVDILAELTRLSEGDPLLVRLYVQELLSRGEDVKGLQPEDLAGIQPGLAGFFKRWWKEQRTQWKKQGRYHEFKEETVQLFFGLCAAALGPLTNQDLEELAGRNLSTDDIDEAIEVIDRFIIGDGVSQGFVLSHPKLNQFFWDRKKKWEQIDLIQPFLDYGKMVIEALGSNKLDPFDASSYIVQHYGAHLERAQELGLVTKEDFYRLVSHGWQKAWNALQGTNQGFLQDVDYAWAVADENRDIAIQVKCALCHSSVATLTSSIPAELLAALLSKEMMTPAQVLAIMERDSDGSKTKRFIDVLAPLLPEKYLPQLLILANNPTHPNSRCLALIAVTPYLPETQRKDKHQQILETAALIQDERSRASVLGALAPQLPEGLLEQALETAALIQDERSRASVLGALAPQLPEGLLEQALETTALFQDEWYRTRVLSDLVPQLPEGLLEQALETAALIQFEESRAEVLSALAPQLPEGLLEQALETTALIQDERSRAEVLSALAPQLPELRRGELFQQALETAALIQSQRSRAEVLSALAPQLPEGLLEQALRTAALIQYEESRAEVLSALAPQLPEGLLEQALETAALIQDEGSRARVLSALAPQLPEPRRGELFQQALETTALIHDEVSRASVLGALAPQLPELRRGNCFSRRWKRQLSFSLKGLAPEC